jgi:hypothetical protein
MRINIGASIHQHRVSTAPALHDNAGISSTVAVRL